MIELCQNIVGSCFLIETYRQVANVAMETTQLVLSQFKNFLTYWIENWIMSVCAKNNQ